MQLNWLWSTADKKVQVYTGVQLLESKYTYVTLCFLWRKISITHRNRMHTWRHPYAHAFIDLSCVFNFWRFCLQIIIYPNMSPHTYNLSCLPCLSKFVNFLQNHCKNTALHPSHPQHPLSSLPDTITLKYQQCSLQAEWLTRWLEIMWIFLLGKF